jgi:hypothetical protein
MEYVLLESFTLAVLMELCYLAVGLMTHWMLEKEHHRAVLVGLGIIIVACCEQYIELESLVHPYR